MSIPSPYIKMGVGQVGLGYLDAKPSCSVHNQVIAGCTPVDIEVFVWRTNGVIALIPRIGLLDG